MIEFRKITVKNFMSVGKKPMGYEFVDGQIYLVCGPNGSGKSLILLDGIMFALFGNSFRGVNNEMLVNSINEKECVAEIEFVIGKTEYRVVRGMKPRFLEIWENGVMRRKESTIPEQQKFLEANILRMDEKTFKQIVLLGSRAYTPFMRLKASHRRVVIEDLLNLGIFSSMSKLVRNKLTELTQEARETDIQVRLVESNINESRLVLENMSGSHSEFVAKKQAVIEDDRRRIEECRNSELGHLESLNALLGKIDDAAHEALQNQKMRFLTMKSNAGMLLQKHSKELTFFEDNTICPTCHQEITEETRERHVHRLNGESEKLKQGMQEVDRRIRGFDKEIEELEGAKAEIDRVRYTITRIKDEIEYLENEIEVITRDIQEYSKHSKGNLEEIERRLVEQNTELTKLKSRQHELLKEGRRLAYIQELVRDGGIKNRIIQTYLPTINQLIAHYMQIMESNIRFSFDENFDETIHSRNRDEFTYDNFSEGEKLRIDLCLLFTFRELSRLRNSTSTNLLIFDEIGDSSLDAEGFEMFIKILSKERAKQCVVIISHSPEKITGKVNRIYEYEKVRDFTQLKSYQEIETGNPDIA